MSEKYDLIIIGAGPGGYVAAISAAQYGMKVALVEAINAGGTCLNRGCIPTKTLLHAANLYSEMKHSDSLGISAEKLSYDINIMHKRKDEVVTGLRGGIESLLKANKVDLLYGRAKILSSTQVMVSKTKESNLQENNSIENDTKENYVLETDKILIATGSTPTRPPIEGINLPGVITSDEALEGQAIDYKNLIIIGGGVIGVEFASIFSSLGCEVTIIEAMERLVPTLDREIAQNLSMILKKRGVTIHTGCTVEEISESVGNLCCHFNGKNGKKELTTQGILVSVGRKPNTSELFGEQVLIKQQRGIVVNQHFETSEKGIYAIGDVIEGSVQLAHAASAQAQNAVAEMFGKKPPLNLNVIPSCIYTNPEIASVGITADQAKENGIEVKTGKYIMSGNGKTIIEQQDRSFIKLVFDAETEVLVGAQLMCARASDFVSELSAAIVGKQTIHQLAAVIRPHPTFSEAITEAVEDSQGRAVHILPKKRL